MTPVAILMLSGNLVQLKNKHNVAHPQWKIHDKTHFCKPTQPHDFPKLIANSIPKIDMRLIFSVAAQNHFLTIAVRAIQSFSGDVTYKFKQMCQFDILPVTQVYRVVE